MSSENEYFRDMIREEAVKILDDGGLKNASFCAYKMQEKHPHVVFEKVFEWVNDVVLDTNDNQEFVRLVSEYAMEFYLDFGTLMTIVSIELAFRVATAGMSGLENVH